MTDLVQQQPTEEELPHPIHALHAFMERLPVQERRLAAVLGAAAPGPVAEEIVQLHRTLAELSQLLYAVSYTVVADIEDLGDDVDEVAEAAEEDVDGEGLSFEDGKEFAELFGILLSMLQHARKETRGQALVTLNELAQRVERAIGRAGELTMQPEEAEAAEVAPA